MIANCFLSSDVNVSVNQRSKSLKVDDSVNDASKRLYGASLKDGVWKTELESGIRNPESLNLIMTTKNIHFINK